MGAGPSCFDMEPGVRSAAGRTGPAGGRSNVAAYDRVVGAVVA